jgi:hypothetical protein
MLHVYRLALDRLKEDPSCMHCIIIIPGMGVEDLLLQEDLLRFGIAQL